MTTKKRMDFVRGLIGISCLSFENMPEYAALVFGVVKLLFNFGATPRLLQWYMIREKVLEMVKVRENLRSRLLFYEVSTANLYVYFCGLVLRRASTDITRVAQKLLKENATLKSDLDELKALILQVYNHIEDDRNGNNSSGDLINNGINGRPTAEVHEPQDEPATAAE